MVRRGLLILKILMNIEEAIRLKKAERPSESDWREFDAGLRRKMLIGLVRRETLWDRFSGAVRASAAAKVAAASLTAAASVIVFHGFQCGAPGGANAGIRAGEPLRVPLGESTFSQNEFSATLRETPLTAKIGAADLTPLRYVSSAPESVGILSF